MRTGFRHGDLVAVGHTFENWDVKDQVFVARQEDDTVHCHTESRQLQIDEHLPFTAVHGVDPGDAMAVGNIWEGIQWGDHRAEIVTAKGDGSGFFVSGYRPDNQTFSRAAVITDRPFVSGDRFALGQIVGESGAPLKEFSANAVNQALATAIELARDPSLFRTEDAYCASGDAGDLPDYHFRQRRRAIAAELAEAFLWRRASSYVGATEVSTGGGE